MDLHLGDGPYSNAFRNNGIYTFKEACEWVRALSYKRNSTKEDPFIVLKESCGTCSSKHELISRLADENRIENCMLILCIFKMSAANTPKIKPVLDRYGLDYIPEAHTYITINEEIFDLTFPESPELLYLNDVLYAEEIFADQIREYKTDTHMAFLEKWCEENDVAYGFEELWGIREDCIMELAK